MKTRVDKIRSRNDQKRNKTPRLVRAPKRTTGPAGVPQCSAHGVESGSDVPADNEVVATIWHIGRLLLFGALRLKRFLKHHLPTAAAAAMGTGLTVLAVQVASERERVAARQEFDTQAAHHLTVTRNAIDRGIGVVNAAAGLLSGSQPADRWTFGEFAAEILPVRPGLRSLQWLPRIPASQRGSYEKRAEQVDGLVGFRIMERDDQWRPVPAAERAEYFPVYYLEPFAGNESSFGEDMFAYPAYRQAMESARDSGEMTAMLERAIETPTGTQVGLLVFQPIYQSEAPVDSKEQRRAALTGFVKAEFWVGDMIDSAVREYTTPTSIDIYVVDAGSGAASNLDQPYVVYFGAAALAGRPGRPDEIKPAPNQLVSEEVWLVADRTWTISVRSADKVTGHVGSPTSWAIGIAGFALSALLSLYLATLTNRHRAIESAVALRTAELSAANQSLYEEVGRRRRIEGELRQAKEQAEVANHAKSAFLAMISHELRTPLNAILGFSEVMSEEIYGPVGNAKYRDYLHDISHSGQHLLGLINNILDLSKVEANEFTLNEEWLDLSEIVNETARLIERKAEEADIAIHMDLAPNLPLLWGDGRAIRQILINLLSNAVKFTPAGGSVTVTGLCDDSDRIVVAIADTGIGIPLEHQKRIFQPFTQVDTSLARKFEGTGLGLPLTRSLAELHRARVSLNSKPGSGTCVTVYFPPSRTGNLAVRNYARLNV